MRKGIPPLLPSLCSFILWSVSTLYRPVVAAEEPPAVLLPEAPVPDELPLVEGAWVVVPP